MRNQRLFAQVPIISLAQSACGARALVSRRVAAPLPSSIAHSAPALSVILCIAVQHVPVPGPTALSMAGQQPTSTLVAPQSPSEQPQCPDHQSTWGAFCSLPDQLRDFTFKEHRHRLPQPSLQASLQRGHHRRWDQPGIIIQGMCDALSREHPRLREADVVVLIASKSLNTLQCCHGFLNPLSRLCRRLSRLAKCDMHAVPRVRRRSRETDTVPLAWDLQTQVANLCRQLLALVLLKPRRPDSTCVASESVTGLGF